MLMITKRAVITVAFPILIQLIGLVLRADRMGHVLNVVPLTATEPES